MSESNAEIETWMDEQQFDEEHKALFRKYYPIAWNKPTQHSEVPGTHITTVPHLFRHARAEEELAASALRLKDTQSKLEARERRARTSEQSGEWATWHAECQARKQRIADAKIKWHARNQEVANKKRELDAWAQEAYTDLHKAQAEPVPLRPVKR